MYGAKVGSTAFQIGAGLSVPVGTQGVIFVDGNADIRSGSSSINGSIGYRYNFYRKKRQPIGKPLRMIPQRLFS